MKGRLRARLKGRAGESIAETLIALVIACLAITMLAGIITSSTRLISQSKDALADYYEANNAIADETAADPKTASVTIEGDGVTQTDGIKYYTNSKLSGRLVIGYKYYEP